MSRVICAPLVALLAGALPLAAQQTATTLESPFVRLTDTGDASGFLTASFDRSMAAAFETAHDQPRATRLEAFPLPGNRTVDLVLRPVSVWEEGGRARVVADDGSVSELAPSIQLFVVHAPGHESSGFLGISREMSHGYLAIDGETYLFSTGADDGTPRPLAVSHDSNFTAGSGGFCNVLEEGPNVTRPDGGSDSEALMMTPDIHETRVFVECDRQFRQRFNSNQATIDYATLLWGASSEIYRRDLGATIVIPDGFVQVWNMTPPWGIVSTFSDLSSFRSWWNSNANPNKDVARAQVHLLTNPVFGGVAQGLGILCNRSSSYAISSCNGSFPYPIRHKSNNNWDLFVVSHEAGHLYGSQHTFDYNPEIQCQDGSGPDRGTIMSYCHLDFGVGQVGMRFHPRVQTNMRGDIASANCPNVIPILLGDYNADGLLDSLDLAAYDAYVAQGFESAGAFETFDMDGNGAIEPIDRQLLEVGVLPPASSTLFFGSGANCTLCYLPVTQPILGTTWTTDVGRSDGPVMLTAIVVKPTLLGTPLPTAFGELLIGGPTLFVHYESTSGPWARHEVALPLDVGLAGREAHSQAVIFKPTGAELLGGMTLVLSTY